MNPIRINGTNGTLCFLFNLPKINPNAQKSDKYIKLNIKIDMLIHNPVDRPVKQIIKPSPNPTDPDANFDTKSMQRPGIQATAISIGEVSSI